MALVNNDMDSGFFICLLNFKRAWGSAAGFCVLCGHNEKTKDYGNPTVSLQEPTTQQDTVNVDLKLGR